MTTSPRSPALERLAAANRQYELMAAAVAAGFGPETKGPERKAKARDLYGQGCRVTDIAALFDVSYQRVQQILGLSPTSSQREQRKRRAERQAASGG